MEATYDKPETYPRDSYLLHDCLLSLHGCEPDFHSQMACILSRELTCINSLPVQSRFFRQAEFHLRPSRYMLLLAPLELHRACQYQRCHFQDVQGGRPDRFCFGSLVFRIVGLNSDAAPSISATELRRFTAMTSCVKITALFAFNTCMAIATPLDA